MLTLLLLYFYEIDNNLLIITLIAFLCLTVKKKIKVMKKLEKLNPVERNSEDV